MSPTWLDDPPEHREARVRLQRGYPYCSACNRRLGTKHAWRCPYVDCETWLRGTLDPDPFPKRKKEDA